MWVLVWNFAPYIKFHIYNVSKYVSSHILVYWWCLTYFVAYGRLLHANNNNSIFWKQCNIYKCFMPTNCNSGLCQFVKKMWKILRKLCSKRTCFWSLCQAGCCILGQNWCNTPSSIENWNFCWWISQLFYFWFSQIGSFVFRLFIMDTLEIDKNSFQRIPFLFTSSQICIYRAEYRNHFFSLYLASGFSMIKFS